MPIRRKTVLARSSRKGGVPVKVRLDARTMITVADMEFFAFWKRRYPMAQVIT